MTLNDIIKHQTKTNNDRIKRAKTISRMVPCPDVNKAIDAGLTTLHAMSKEQIIERYIDTIDVIFIGLFADK